MKKLNNYKIQKRKDGRWYVQVSFQKQKYYIYGSTQKEVKEKLSQRLQLIQEAQANQIRNFSSANTSLYTWAKCCLENYSKAHVRGNTYASYICILENYILPLGNKKLNEITNIMIQQHLISLTKKNGKDKLSSKMLQNIRNFLSLVFRYAIQNDMLLRNPAKGIHIPQEYVREPRSLTLEEQNALILAARQHSKPIMFSVILALYTGLRKGELLGLQWQDIDFRKKRIAVTKQLVRQTNLKDDTRSKTSLQLVEPKTKASIRFVFLIDDLAKDLLEYKEKMIEWKRENNYAHSETDFVFCNSQNGAIEPRRYYQYYMEVMEEANIENANFHTLRHTFTTRCLEAGLDIVSVSKILGHAEVQITANTYTHLLAEHQKAEMQKIRKWYV